ncbi:MAG: hypothetical protein JXQ71_08175 [Verrucomicrobia bacterium]|nr:hypothetical protein [Verrucomicrobiota bacterium]
MVRQVDTRAPGAVEEEVRRIYRDLFPEGDPAFVSRAFEWAGQCFSGRYADYQAIDARYHDFEHTLQGTLCLAQLLWGRHRAQAKPALTVRMFELGLLAILFHDTGYLKERDDTEGTGAKYTLVHVDRSALFAQEFLAARGYGPGDITAIQNMIHCTGVNADLPSIVFRTELEQTIGFALGTADLLGQMAARDYVDKLPILFAEFAEAARAGGEPAARFVTYTSAEVLMKRTPGFWEGYVRPRIAYDFLGLYKYLNDPYPDGPNPYIGRIEENIARLRRQFAGS